MTPPDQQKTPLRFWIWGIIAVATMILTTLWFASLFSGTPKDGSGEDKLKDARMLRPL
jgi:hypothetical protein